MRKNDKYFNVTAGGDGLPTNYSAVNVLQYTGDTTYSPSSNLLYARVVCVGGGGGGGSGRVEGLGIATNAGGGAQGGCIASRTILKSEINPTGETITIGAGGTGAAGVTNAGTQSGNIGSNGGNTSFGSLVFAKGGRGGTKGGGAGDPSFTFLDCVPPVWQLSIDGIPKTGQGGTIAINAIQNLYLSLGGGCNGGSGCGKSAANATGNGGLGGRSYDKDGNLSAVISGGTAGGGHGQNGLDNVSLQIIEQYPISGVTAWNTLGIGTGGAGGGGSVTAGIPGGNGGNGGLYGAGGGGGGVGLTGAAPNGSGAGGDGAQGLCIIIEYLK